MAFLSPSTSSSTLGSHRTIMSGSSTSGTPPTFVDTTKRPQLAASKIAIQNDSVREQFKNTCPCRNTFATLECGTAPRKSTRSCRCSRSTISCRFNNLLPSPPTIKSTSGNRRQIFGIIPTNKSTPFRYTSLDTTTTFIRPSALRFAGSGVNLEGSTALGMTVTRDGSSFARSIRLSRQACETQMAAFNVLKVVSRTRFKMTPAKSSN
mmetsp:Transcript_1320/g.2322  ORF Transcript_1320/g.2322 Transcript_1320/m.2322 type:complete len:208 (+) Transcript_1320:667-1290(+)